MGHSGASMESVVIDLFQVLVNRDARQTGGVPECFRANLLDLVGGTAVSHRVGYDDLSAIRIKTIILISYLNSVFTCFPIIDIVRYKVIINRLNVGEILPVVGRLVVAHVAGRHMERRSGIDHIDLVVKHVGCRQRRRPCTAAVDVGQWDVAECMLINRGEAATQGYCTQV